MNRADKFKKLNAKDTKKANNMVIMTDGGPFIEALQKKIDELRKTMGVGVEVKMDKLIDELVQIQTITPAVEELKTAIKEIVIPEMPEEVEVSGIDDLSKTVLEHIQHLRDIKEFKIPDAKVKVEIVDNQKIGKITERLDNLIKAVQDNTFEPEQSPADFIPIRRVKLIANKLMFDDSFWGGGGGGGGASVQNALISGNSIKVVNPDGSTVGQEQKGSSATLTNVGGSASSVTLLASNADRISARVANDSTAILYVKFGSSASTTSYTHKLFQDDELIIDDYTGIITGIWASATGNARVTEI